MESPEKGEEVLEMRKTRKEFPWKGGTGSRKEEDLKIIPLEEGNKF